MNSTEFTPLQFFDTVGLEFIYFLYKCLEELSREDWSFLYEDFKLKINLKK